MLYLNIVKDVGDLLHDRQSTYCIKCGHEIQRVTEWPTREELKNLIRNKTFTFIGKEYNVSDTAVKKWCVHYGLPKTKKEIKKYSDEEWDNI